MVGATPSPAGDCDKDEIQRRMCRKVVSARDPGAPCRGEKRRNAADCTWRWSGVPTLLYIGRYRCMKKKNCSQGAKLSRIVVPNSRGH